VIELRATSEDFGMRFDVFLARNINGLSRKKAGDLINKGDVLVDGRRVYKNYVIQADQLISYDLESIEISKLKPNPEIKVSMLYEDPDLVVVFKPAGIHCAPLHPNEECTLVHGLLAIYPEMEDVGFSPLDPGICHRLDFWTSGVLLAARTQSAFLGLANSFKSHQVEKKYLAIVIGNPPDSFTVDEPIGHPSRRSKKVVVGERKGRGLIEARTTFSVKKRIGNFALVEANTFYGAMHQIRAHLSWAGFPLLGDELYGGLHESAGRFWLHAQSVCFATPSNNQKLTVSAPIPDDFKNRMDALRSC